MKKILTTLALALLAVPSWAQVVRFPACTKTATETISSTTKVFGCPAETVGLVSYWPLTEASGNRSDSVGSNTLTDNNTVTSAALGPNAVAAKFTRASSETLTNASFPIDYDADYSLSLWVTSAWTAGEYHGLFHTGDDDQRLFLSDALSGAIQAEWGGANAVAAPPVPALGVWTHIVTVWDGTANLGYLYVNGALIGSIASAPTGTTTGVTFGSLSGVHFDNGNMSRAGIWSRKLEAVDVTSLYNSGRGKSYSSMTAADKVGLSAFWNMDEASGDRADSFASYTLTDVNTVTSLTNSYPANMPGIVASFVAANSESFSTAGSIAEFGGTSFTFAGWFRYTTTGSVTEIVWNGAAGPGLQIETDNDLTLYATATDYRITTATGVIPDSTWAHLVWTYDGNEAAADRFKLYVNDTGIATAAGNGAIPTSISGGSPFTIARYPGSVFHYGGGMSQPMLYSRVLSATDRTALYNAGAGKFWTFN